MKNIELYFIKFSLVIIFFLLVWGAAIMYKNYVTKPMLKEKILKNMTVLNGARIDEIGQVNKVSGLLIFNYDYYVKDQYYKNKNTVGIEIRTHSANLLLKKSLPIVYETHNPSNSLLLIKPSDFTYFNIPFPDSLNWLIENVIEK